MTTKITSRTAAVTGPQHNGLNGEQAKALFESITSPAHKSSADASLAAAKAWQAAHRTRPEGI